MENTNNFLSKFKMFFVKNGQKMLLLSFFILICLCIVYSLAFMTPYVGAKTSGVNYVLDKYTGKDFFYYPAQGVNNFLFQSSAIMIIVMAIAFIVGNKSRNKYYKVNFVFGFGSSILAIVFSIVAMIRISNALLLLQGIPLSPFMTSTGEIYCGPFGGNVAVNRVSNVFNLGLSNDKDEFASLTVNTLYNDGIYEPSKASVFATLGYVLYTILLIVAVAYLALVIYKLLKQVVFDKKKVNDKVNDVEEATLNE